MGCTKGDPKEDNDVKSEKGVTSEESPVRLSNNVVLNEDFFEDVEVG